MSNPLKNNQSSIVDKVTNGTNKVMDFAKSKVFDIIGTGIVLSMCMIILNALELKEINSKTVLDTFVEFIPFYIAATLLSFNYYTKGSFAGKKNQTYLDIVDNYSITVDAITGEQISRLDEFCEYYNDRALMLLQQAILKPAGITFEEFDVGVDGKRPLKVLTIRELHESYKFNIIVKILHAKLAKVKGINSNILLSNMSHRDITNIGKTEKQMAGARTAGYAFGFVFSVLMLTLIAVKKFLEWGWASLFVLAFKLIYVVCRSCMRYFDGYKDITINLVNHLGRKCDILKEFNSWVNTDNNTAE